MSVTPDQGAFDRAWAERWGTDDGFSVFTPHEEVAHAFYEAGCRAAYLSVQEQPDEREVISEERLDRLIDKMLDYDLFADPEDVERQRVVACDLIRTVRDTEQQENRMSGDAAAQQLIREVGQSI
jgi:hypothetical protein